MTKTIRYIFLAYALIVSNVLYQQQAAALAPHRHSTKDQNSEQNAGFNVYHREDVGRRLSGRFLHLTDMHPDPLYKPGSVASSGCHVEKPNKESWRVGYWGAPVSGCDSPVHLVERSVQWISDNWMPSNPEHQAGLAGDDQTGFDFIIWTGDSARHDIDSNYPRTRQEIYDLNRWCLDLIHRYFPRVPIVPNIGNNDIFPHNIMWPGPNDVTKAYAEIWADEIPEYELHIFQLGGYFSREIIPRRLAVISLNTLYFYDSNKVVDGCKRISRERKKERKNKGEGIFPELDDGDEGQGEQEATSKFDADDIRAALLASKDPGTIQLIWLEAQLHHYQQRKMGVHIIGHVPPTANNYFPRCYDAYTDIVLHYQEVVIGQHFGHMNIDAFFVQEDTKAVRREGRLKRKDSKFLQHDIDGNTRSINNEGGERTVGTTSLSDNLRKDYALLSGAGGTNNSYYHFFFAAPSIVPTFLPSVRIWTYNTSGLDVKLDVPNVVAQSISAHEDRPQQLLYDEEQNFDEVEAQEFAFKGHPSALPATFSRFFSSKGQTAFLSSLSASSLLPSEEHYNHALVATSERLEDLKRKHRRSRHSKKHKHRRPAGPRHASPDSPIRTNKALSLIGYSQWILDLNATNERWKQKPAGLSHESSVNKIDLGRNVSTFNLDFQLEYATYTAEVLWGSLVEGRNGSVTIATSPVPRHLLVKEMRRHKVEVSDFAVEAGDVDCQRKPKLRLPKPLKRLTDWKVESITVPHMLRLARRLAVDDKMWGRYRARIYGSSGYTD